MSKIKAAISNQIFLAEREVRNQEELRSFCRSKLNFFNPKVIELRRLGFSVWGVPKMINCFKELKSGWYLPMGFWTELKEYCTEKSIELVVEDRRSEAEIGKVEQYCRIVAKPEQEAVLTELLARERAVLCAKPGFGKTMAGLLVFARRQQKTLVIVHTRALLHQWQKRISDYFDLPEGSVGVIGEGKWQIGKMITVASYQTLLSRGVKKIASEFGLVIIDECHHVPAATFTKIASAFAAKYYLGLSATPYRKDRLDKMIGFYIGPVVAATSVVKNDDEVMEAADKGMDLFVKTGGLEQSKATSAAVMIAGEVCPTKFVFHETDFGVANPDLVEFTELGTRLIADEKRNEQIADDIAAAIKNRAKCLVLTERVAHGDTLLALLRTKVPRLKAVVVTGKMPKKKREEILTQVRANKYQVLLATGSLIGEGFDWPRADHLFLTYPFSWKGKAAQYVGRVQRMTAGKTNAMVTDYVDLKVPMLRAMARRRYQAYKQLKLKPAEEN